MTASLALSGLASLRSDFLKCTTKVEKKMIWGVAATSEMRLHFPFETDCALLLQGMQLDGSLRVMHSFQTKTTPLPGSHQAANEQCLAFPVQMI